MEAVNKQDIIKGDPFGEIQKEIAEALGQLDKFDQGLKDTAKSFEGLSKNSRKTVQDIDAITKAEIESEKLLKQKVITQQTETKLLIEQEKLKQAAIRTAKAENSIKEKTLTLYQQESRKLNDLRNAYKNLAVQNKENTKEAKALLAQITPLDAKLKAIDKTVGQSQRSVGNYGSALDNLKGKFGSLIGLASQFGLALGGVALVRGAITTIAEFETQVADLSAVTGQTGKDLDFLKEKAIDFSKKYGESAASIATAFKLAGSARPELLKNGAAMADLTEKAIILSKASGDDVPTSIKNLTGTLNAFELPATAAGKVMDILANAAQLGSQEIPYLTEAFTKFGAIAKSSNIDVAESAAAIEILGQKMPDAASAGTGLRNVMLKLMAPDALGKDAQDRLKALGVNFDDLKDKSKPFADRLDALKPLLTDSTALVKVFGTENAVAAQILLSQTDQLREFTSGLDKNGTALGQAETKSKTLAEAGARLKANIEGLVLEMLNGVNASSGLSSALDLLANNLESIVYWIGKGIQVFVTYKAAMLALNMKDRITEFIKFKDTAKDASGALTAGESGAKKFGAALKGIGFGLAITAAIELVTAFYDIASGAEAARDAAARLDKQLTKSSKDAAARVSERTNSASTQIAELQRLRNENKITEKEFLAQKKAITEATKDEVKTDIQKVNARKAQYLEEQKALKERIRLLALENSFSANLQIRELGFELNQVNANIQGSNVRLKEYYAELLAVGEVTKDLNSELVIEEKGLNSTTKSTKQKAKAVEDLTNKVEDSFLTLEQMHEMEMRRLEEEKRIMQEINELNRELNNDMANDNTIVDVIPEEFSDMELLGLGIISDSMKEKFNAFEEFQKGLTNILTEQIDARIAQLKKEEDAAKSTQDYLQELAASGNINAQQSITQAIEFQRESQAEQARLERTKQQIQLISSGLSTFNKEIADGKKPGEALVSTGFVMQTLIGLLKNVQFFAKGTDNAPEGLAVVDEKGAEIITDKKGKIKEIGTGKGARFTHLSKGDKVFTANQTANILDQFGNIQNGQTIDRRFDVAGNSYDLMMLNKLGGIEKAIKESGSSSHTEWGGIFNGVGEIVERKMKNGNIVTNRYRMKS